MNNRSFALDALRGYAILTMVLSATISFHILPGWMYHAQTPPPDHAFNPTEPGLTWVDLVFPFFLFAMGAAFPFSIKRKIEKGETKKKAILEGFKRYFQLAFFAIFIYHLSPWALSSPQDSRAWGLALLAFALLFPMFMRIPIQMPKWAHSTVKIVAFVIAFVLMYTVHYAGDRVFDSHFADIIILIMAHMAGFGTLIYVFTMYNKTVRIAVLFFIMAIQLGSGVEGSINHAIWTFTPAAWLFKFEYLKYLFIIIPGSIAGEYLLENIQTRKQDGNVNCIKDKATSYLLLVIGLAHILVNLCCLYNRWLAMNIVINSLLLFAGYFVLRKKDSGFIRLWKNLFIAGGFMIILGLFFEAYEGGIKKDPTTFSYYLVSSGLAFMALMIFSIICDYYKCYRSTSFLVMTGQNPMIAYVATGLLTGPVLNLLGIMPLFSVFSTSPWLGFLQGVILTSIAMFITMFFTRIKWFWRT